MSDYQYKNIPLTPSIAAELVVEYLSTLSTPVKRVELTRYVAERHQVLGGLNVNNTQGRVMSALGRLVDEGKVQSPSHGWYALCCSDFNTMTSELDQQQPSVDNPLNDAELIVAEETIGKGDELVYVYYSEVDRKLAKYEERDWWPCKVGFTAGNLTTRILAQGPMTSMARLPSVGLVIKTDDGHALERALHYALDESDSRIIEALGSEWFETSPSRIKLWHEKYLLAVDTLRR
jgi:T5orf172 domain